MVKTKPGVVQFVVVLMTIASLMLVYSPSSFAQSTSSPAKNLYFIMGAVKNPGVYQIESAPSLPKLLALAGGLTYSHGPAAFIVRKLPAQPVDQYPEFNLIQVRIDDLLQGNLEATVNLEPGDIVNIPPADVFYVAGDVSRPGSFPFKEGTTLLQAISDAGGLKASAKGDKAIIFRQDPSNGTRQEINIDLHDVTSGKQKDIPLQPHDIVVIPNARARTTMWPGFPDAPPIRVLVPCSGFLPCISRLDLGTLSPAN